MEATASARRTCDGCAARLSRSNTEALCHPCQQRRHAGFHGAPAVLETFWRETAMAEALTSRHIGRIIHAYRHHAPADGMVHRKLSSRRA